LRSYLEEKVADQVYKTETTVCFTFSGLAYATSTFPTVMVVKGKRPLGRPNVDGRLM
jgi:hypothetical protein